MGGNQPPSAYAMPAEALTFKHDPEEGPGETPVVHEANSEAFLAPAESEIMDAPIPDNL